MQTTRFVSVEPQLETVDLRQHLLGLDWIIQGGESGTDPRPFDVAWARRLRDQCREAAVDYFLKQLGAKPYLDGKPLRLADGHGADWDEWPEDLCVREVPVVVASDDGQCPATPDIANTGSSSSTTSPRRV